jgi:hypothetical protein
MAIDAPREHIIRELKELWKRNNKQTLNWNRPIENTFRLSGRNQNGSESISKWLVAILPRLTIPIEQAMNEDFEDYLEAEVLDQAARVIGNLECYWTDEEGETLFLGIKTPTAKDATAVVPVVLAEANERQSCVILSVQEEKIRKAPLLECDAVLDRKLEEKLYKYYDLAVPDEEHHLQLHPGA